jgi:hypothetical protein
MNGFWKTWLVVWCWGVVAFGAVLALAAAPGLDGTARFILAAFSTPETAALLDMPAMRFAFGLQGALSIGWALTVLTTLRVADFGGAPVWQSLTLSVAAWYVIDSTISVSTGFPLNAVSNTVLFAAFLAPIVGSGVLRARAGAVAA